MLMCINVVNKFLILDFHLIVLQIEYISYKIFLFQAMALQSNQRLSTNRQGSGEEEGRRGVRHGNIKKPKKLLSERFGSISKFASTNENPCGTNIRPMNQELMDFETRMLKRKYNNLKVSVQLEGIKDPNQAAPGFTFKNGPYSLSNQSNEENGSHMGFYHERFRNECNSHDATPKTENFGRYTSVPTSHHHQGNETMSKDPIADGKQSQKNMEHNMSPTHKESSIGKTHDALKRPFFYAEQNCVPLKKRYMDFELQQTKENDLLTGSKNKKDAFIAKSNVCCSKLQQGASTPSSTTSEQYGADSSMLFEGRTLLKGGVMPRHIPKNVVQRDDKELPSDPRPLKPDYGMQNLIMEYKVLLWHKDWLFDYTKELLAKRRSEQTNREHKRVNFVETRNGTKDDIWKKEFGNHKSTQKMNEKYEAKMQEKTNNTDSLARESSVMDRQKANDLETSVSRLIENVRSGACSKANKQCFEYEHSHIRKDVTHKSDPRLKKGTPQQFDANSRKNNANRRENNDYVGGSSLKASLVKNRNEQRQSKFPNYDRKQKYSTKSSLDRVILSRGKTGAVLRENEKRTSPNFSSGKEVYQTVSTSNMHSTYNNKELSPIYQGNKNCNQYQNHLPRSQNGNSDLSSKGKDIGMDIYPQFCREHWY